jgi:hypothetical protein
MSDVSVCSTRHKINEIKDGTWSESLTAIVSADVELNACIVPETREQKLVKATSKLFLRSFPMVDTFCFAPRIVA